MTKSFTKIWLGGLKRLLAIQSEHIRKTTKRAGLRPARAATPTRATTKPAAKPTVKARKPATRGTPPARESRVRPRAAAWATGHWTRSFHSAPVPAGRLVNHLSYGLYLPAERPTTQMPVVVMLHGCKQSIDEFAEGSRMNLLADRYGFAVLYPEQSKHAHAHRCWHWYDTSEHTGLAEARAVDSLVESLVEQHGFDRERVYVAGLSAGAGLATLLAAHYPQRFAAVALHSGPMFGEAHSGITAMDVMRRGSRHDPVALVDKAVDVSAYPGMPAIILQGDDDPVVAPVNAEQLAVQFLRLNGLVDARGSRRDGQLREERRADVVVHDYLQAGRRVVSVYRIGSLGHAWSGGDDTVPFHSSKGPDASALIWDFFRLQRRAAPAETADRSAAARL